MVAIFTVADQAREERRRGMSYEARARRKRLDNKGADAGRKYRDGWVRQAADDDFLGFIVRFEAMTVEQAAKWFYNGSMPRAWRRIRYMAHAGLVRKYKHSPATGTIVLPTVAAVHAVVGKNSPLVNLQPPAPSRINHILFVAEAAAATMKKHDDPRSVISEREIRHIHNQPEEKIIDFLRSYGVKIYPDDPRGIRPATASVRRTRDGQSVMVDTSFWVTVHTRSSYATYRIPDFIEIRDGYMWAVEVEIAEKESARVFDILRGYRDARVGHATVGADTSGDLATVKPAPVYRQFRGVRWICSETVADRLTGPRRIAPRDVVDPNDEVLIPAGNYVYGVDPLTNKPSPGWVEKIWNESPNGRLMFRNLADKSLTNPKRPVTVEKLDVHDLPGLDYLLAQAVMTTRFHADYREWQRWRKLWEQDTHDTGMNLRFTDWLSFNDNLQRCLAETRSF